MKKKVYIVISVVSAFLILTGVMLSKKLTNKNAQNSEIIGKTEEIQGESDIQALETEPQVPTTWDLTKVKPALSEDNILVPVPIGFTVSTDENERYVNGTWLEKRASSTPISFNANETDSSKWTLREDGTWVSGKPNVRSSSTLMSDEFTIENDGDYISLEVTTDSSSNNYLNVRIEEVTTGVIETLFSANGYTKGMTYETLKWATIEKKLKPGTYKLSIVYSRNSNYSYGLDRGFVKNGKKIKFDEDGNEIISTREKSGGFVIYEGEEITEDLWTASKQRNQFVWIPVEKPSETVYNIDSTTGKRAATIRSFSLYGIESWRTSNREPGVLTGVSDYSRQGLDVIRWWNSSRSLGGETQGYTKDRFYKELEIEYNNTIKSIEKYGGFYIGRYETGNLSKNNPVSKRMNTDIANQNWYNMFIKMKNISSNPNIQTSMIWNCLWEEALQWLIDTNEISLYEMCLDANSWGNCKNSTFQYYNDAGTLVNTKENNKATKIPTGSAEYTKANNIYDISGNVYEVNLAVNSSMDRVSRGTCYDNTLKDASSRWGGAPDFSYSNKGYRAFLYIK